MTLEELFDLQKDKNKLKSLYLELANHQNFNPYKNNIISDMPKGGTGKDFLEWYMEEMERIEKDIEFYKDKVQQDRRRFDEFIDTVKYPECDVIRYRIVNGLNWYDIGELLNIDRRTASRWFYDFLAPKSKVAHNAREKVIK